MEFTCTSWSGAGRLHSIQKPLQLKRCIFMMMAMLPALMVPSAIYSVGPNPTAQVAIENIRMEEPGLRMHKVDQRITRLYGKAFGSGSSASATAEGFRQSHSRVFGVDPADLKPLGRSRGGQRSQGVMYDRQAGTYKFTLVYYSQFKGDLPVFRSELRLLIKNESDYPLVSASSSLRSLRQFQVNPSLARSDKSQIVASFKDPDFPNIARTSEPKTVIWAGYDEIEAEPSIAIEFTASDGEPATQAWLYLIDAESGAILYKEDLIIRLNVTGNVSGLATQGPGADSCEIESSESLPYARVNTNSGQVAFSDQNGDFTLPYGGFGTTVESRIWGEWFRVFNMEGADALLTQSANPFDPVNFVHNQTNDDEFLRAQVNAYVEANKVRDMILAYNPSYPSLQENELTISVNRDDVICPGNAWYNPVDTSMNFCKSGTNAGGSDFPNTAFSGIIHHEYGHHLVQMAGSGQGQYGEGMGDAIANLLSDNQGLGYGFIGYNCSEPLRNADSDIQYPCFGEVHDCGILLSACIWSIRNELQASHPGSYLDILSDLTINSILLHTGFTVNPQIAIDFLTLDDDDGNLENGTPHSSQILAGFEDHNMGIPDYRTIWVDATLGDDITGDGSENLPFATIPKGIETAAYFGDTVFVRPGTYTEFINFLGKAVVVTSTDGPLVTTIQGGPTGDLVAFINGEDMFSVLEGFTLREGFRGINCRYSGPTIRGNVLINQHHIGINCFNDLLGSGQENVPMLYNNSIIFGNSNGIWSETLVPSTMKNNIVAFNGGRGIRRISWPFIGNSAHPDLSYNDVYGNSPDYDNITDVGIGSISTDPLLRYDSVSLALGSPCIDAGDPDPEFSDPDGSRNDMGGIPYYSCCVLRGDVNNDGSVTIVDVTYLINYVFNSGSPPPCLEQADVNGDGPITAADIIYLYNYVLLGGPPPPPC